MNGFRWWSGLSGSGSGRCPAASSFLFLLLFLQLTVSPCAAQDPDYLSAGELLAIGAASGGALVLGMKVAHFDPEKPSRWATPPEWELRVSRWMGGEPRAGKRNFLDDVLGAALTPALAGALVLGADLAYPVQDRGREALQDMGLMVSGVAATKGITDIVKGIVARPRPLTHMAPEIASAETEHDPAFAKRSFFSGHAATAFFSAAYLERHARATMKREMSSGDYRGWRWAPPLISYGWATVVGISRIQAQRHYVTDVVAGALAGIGMGALFYSLGDDYRPEGGGDQTTPPILLTFSLSF